MSRIIDRKYTQDFIYRVLSEADLDFYEDQGYLLLGRTLTDRGLSLMQKQCMEAWNAHKESFTEGKTWTQNALLSDIHHCSDVACRYFFSGPLVDISVSLVAPNLKGASSQLTFKMRHNTQPFHWHQDTGYAELAPDNTLTTLTALDDCDVENGCLWIVPGSHKQGRINVNYTNEDRKSQVEIKLDVDESQARPMEMKAGECLVFHNWMLHKSEGNRSDRDRRVLFLRYADADAVEVYNEHKPRLGRLLRGVTKFPEIETYESSLL